MEPGPVDLLFVNFGAATPLDQVPISLMEGVRVESMFVHLVESVGYAA
jgi:hypothetical protein